VNSSLTSFYNISKKLTALPLAWLCACGEGNENNNNATSTPSPTANVVAFTDAEIFLEQNFTDGDSEAVILAKGGDEGLQSFQLVGPNGVVIYNFDSPKNGQNIGGREIILESPEPSVPNEVLSAYPEGAYTFLGETVSGIKFKSTAELSHALSLPASITFPTEAATVLRSALTVTWGPVTGAEEYVVELKNTTTDLSLTVQVPADTTAFQVPQQWIVPGMEYQVSVTVVNDAGNKVSSELSFFTMNE
jgi:hypothetical protein